jgi:hypothetical protein
MNAERRRTHVWEIIARHAFTPRNDRDRAAWLFCFSKSIYNYLDVPIVEMPQSGVSFAGTFGCRSLDFECQYNIQPERADFTLLVPSCKWQLGVESTVFACIPCLHEWEEARDELTKDDVTEVLRGMIEHPRTHLHIHQNAFPHDVRIATGYCAPFLFLFQLRFQLCIDPTRRQAELSRLTRIFTLDWLKRECAISPQALFGLQRNA